MKTSATQCLWITDADNTLWETDAVYARAQLELLDRVEAWIGQRTAPNVDRLSFVREIDQSIATRHHRGLRYASELLALALSQRLSGRGVAESVRHAMSTTSFDTAIHAASEQYLARLGDMPLLRPGVLVGMSRLKSANADVVVATEGSKGRIERTLAHHHLDRFIRHCIEAPKTPEFFARLAKASRAETSWAIGDQLDRDILPASRAGLNTIYFPGSFAPRWHREGDAAKATLVVTNYEEAVARALSPSEPMSAHPAQHRTAISK